MLQVLLQLPMVTFARKLPTAFQYSVYSAGILHLICKTLLVSLHLNY